MTKSDLAGTRWRWLILACAGALAVAGCDVFRSADDRVARAEEQIAAHDYRGAMIELKNALQDEPGHVAARTRLAYVEFELGDLAAAEKDLKQAVTLGAESPEVAELQARMDLAFGRAQELLARIDSQTIGLEGSARPMYRGQALLSLQRYDEALREYESIAADDPRSVEARVGASESLAAAGRNDEAMQRIEALIAEKPQVAIAWLARGVLHARAGNSKLAEEDLARAHELGRDSLGAIQRMMLLAQLTELRLARADLEGAAASHSELAQYAPDALPVKILGARILLARQDHAGAVAQLQRAVTLYPNAMNARFLLGAALLAQGNLHQAELQLTQVLERAPENIEARKLLAQIHLRQNRPDSATQVLLPAEQPDDARFDFLLGLARLQQGDEVQGIAHLERAAAAAPDNKGLRLDLATAYLKIGRADKAIELLSTLDRSGADMRQSALMIAALSAAGDARAARAEVEKLLAARPKDPDAFVLGAAYYTRERGFDRARDLAQRAIALDPKGARPLLVRAHVEEEAGALDAARGWLDKAVALDTTGSATLALARLLIRRGDTAAAAAALEKLRERDPAAIEPRLMLASLYLRQRNAATSRALIDELMAIGKDKPEVQNALGELLLGSERYDEALARFLAATELDPSDPASWRNVARVRLALNDPAGARTALGRAISVQPGWLPANGALVMLDVKEGRREAALARVAQLRTSRPHDEQIMALEGDVYMALGDFAKAAAAYDGAYAERPSGAAALRRYNARRVGKLPAPRQPLEQWLAANPNDAAVRLVLAEALMQEGSRAAAVSQYEAMMQAPVVNPIALNNLAWAYYELGDPRAEATGRRAHEAAPRSAEVADTYGWILLQNGKTAQAVPVLKQAADASQDPSIRYHYAVALIRSGEAEQGRGRLNELLKGPDFPEAAEARKLLAASPSP